MPRVPQYEQQVSIKAPNVSTPNFSAPPEAAFGGELAAANARLGKTIQGVGEALSSHIVERKKRDDHREVLAQDTEFRKEWQNTLYSQDQDDTGKPVGLMNRQLEYASGATIEHDERYTGIRQKYLNKFQDDGKKSALAGMMDQYYESTRAGVIRHEAEQGNKAYLTRFESNMKQRVTDSAAIADPVLLTKAIEATQTEYLAGVKRQGLDEQTAGQNAQVLAGEMVKSSFSAILEKSPQKAGAILSSLKGKIPATTAAELEKVYEGKALDDAQLSAWKRVSGLRMVDGNPDIEKMKSAVMGMGSINGVQMNADRKLKIAGFVEAMAKDQMQQRKFAEAAGDYAFKNDILDIKAKGGRLGDALKTIADKKYGPADNVMKAERQEIAKKIWTEKTITDPETYNNIWFAVANGQAGRAEIDAAYQKGLLSSSDWQGLGKHWYGTEHKSDDILMKHTMDRVQILADNSFSSSKKKAKDEFIYAVMQGVKGKTPAETLEYANKLLEKDPSTGFLGFFQKQNYKIENQITDVQHQAAALIMKDLGSEVTSAILDGKYKGKPGDPISAVDEFASAFGGREKIAPGSTVHKVIKAMQAKGWTVTPETVRNVMKQKKLKE